MSGYGRLRMSVLFKSVAISIPPPLKAWDIGVLAIRRIRAHTVPPMISGHIEVTVGTVVLKTPGKPTIDASTSDCLWTCDPILNFPVLHRHQTSVVLQVKMDGTVIGEAVAWLSSIPDEDPLQVKLPIYARDFARLQQNNYSSVTGISYADSKRHKRQRQENSATPAASPHLPASIGHLDVELRFEPGISWLHHNVPQAEGVTDIQDGEASPRDPSPRIAYIEFQPCVVLPFPQISGDLSPK